MAHSSGIPITGSGRGSGAPDGTALTYDLEAADAAVRKRSQLRLMLNDIEAGRGPRPPSMSLSMSRNWLRFRTAASAASRS